MDFHIYTDNRSVDEQKSNRFPFLKMFAPIFGLAVLLPVFMFFALTPNRLNFTSQANQQGQLRLWFEPSSVATEPGVPVRVNVMAGVDNESKQVYNLNLFVKADQNISITPSQLEKKEPFAGRITLGTIEITPTRSGNFTVDIPADLVKTQDANISISTAQLQLLVTQ